MNSQISHFNPEVNPTCSFCAWFPSTNPPKEDFLHFFLNCRFVRNVLDNYFDNIFGEPIDVPKLLFKGHLAENNIEILYVNLKVMLVCYLIWRAKLSKKIPNLGTISIMISCEKNSMMNSSNLYRKIVLWIKKNKLVGNITEHMKNLDKYN